MKLFKAPPVLRFEKVAVPFTKMTGAVDRWPEVIVATLTQQAPYLGAFDLNPSITKYDAAQGHGVGFIAASIKTDRTLTQQATTKPVNTLRIPFIIKDWQLYPFDLFMRGDMIFPLTEKRVKESMSSPEIFDGVGKPPKDTSIASDLYPPSSGGSEASYFGWASSQLSKQASFCQVLGSFFLDDRDIKKMASALDEPGVGWHVERHEWVAPLVSALSSPQEKVASIDPLRDVPPSVVQIQRLHNGNYRLKVANTGTYRPVEQEVPARIAKEAAAGQDLSSLKPGDSLTALAEPGIRGSGLLEAGATRITKHASAQVMTGKTSMTRGTVFPIRDLDGKKLASMMFYGAGSEGKYAIQEKIAGAETDPMPDFANPLVTPSDKLEGEGFLLNPKTAEATLPFRVVLVSSVGGQPKIMIKQGGKSATLDLVEGIESPVKLAAGQYAVPSHFKFRKVAKKTLRIEADPKATFEGFQKVAHAKDYVEVMGDRSGMFTLRSPCLSDVDKGDFRRVKAAQAEFMLGVMGVEPSLAKEKMKLAMSHGPQTIYGAKKVVPSSTHGEAIKTALDKLAGAAVFDTRVCLLKEALEVDSPETVDSILSLNFLRPENVNLFVERLPHLEKSVTHLADLLFAARLGLKTVSEDAVRRSLFALEEAVQGLKVLAQAGQTSG